MFDYDLTDELKAIIKRLNKKDKKLSLMIAKKVKEIINNDSESIDRYKNLRYDLKDKKRVHIGKHFVLCFKVNKVSNFILFTDFDHHDNVY